MKGKGGGTGKRIPAYIKGIPTNQPQLQSKKGKQSEAESDSSGT